MTQIFQSPPAPPERSRTDVGITAVCIATVAVAALFSRKTGACGTGHYVFFKLLGGMLVSLVEEVWQSRYDRIIADVAAYLLNVAVFCALVRVWYRKASQGRYIWGALALTGFYLLSYFFLLPTVDCP